MHILHFFISLLFFYLADGADDCKVANISNSGTYTNPIKILDIYEGEVAFFPVSDDITNVYAKNSPYLDASLTENRVSVFTTEEYKYLEEQVYQSRLPKIYVDIVFECANGISTLYFSQPIEDTNNHDPYFDQEQYLFMFGMDIAAGVVLTGFHDVIASDGDISNALIYFSVEDNEYITIERGGSVPNSKFQSTYATIQTVQDLQLPFETSITITATDSEEPVRNVSAIVTIRLIAADDIVPSPVFTKPVYLANYLDNVLLSEDIILSHGYGYEFTVTQRGYEENFIVKVIDEIRGIFSVTVLDPLPEGIYTEKHFITLEIEVQNSRARSAGRCTILIRF